MNIPQIQDGLKRLFDQEGQRIVFWNDSEGEFEETLPALALEDVNLLRLDQSGALEIKIRLEQEDPQGRYLIYAPMAEPLPEEDWLLDIRLFSRSFYADLVSIWLDELGLQHRALRNYLSQHKKFLNNSRRLQSLKKLVHPDDQERELDLKILAVLTRTDQPEIFTILIKLLSEFCDEDGTSLENTPASWEEIEKFELVEALWTIISETFGYHSEETPSLKNLLLHLLVTDFVYHVESSPPSNNNPASSSQTDINFLAPVKQLTLPQGTAATNAVILLSQWRENLNYFQHYEKLSGLVAEELQLSNILQNAEETVLLHVKTFELVEQRIISRLRDQLVASPLPSFESIQETIAQRRDGHWANPLLADREGSRQNRYHRIYKAIEFAAELLILQEDHQEGFNYSSAETLAQAYTEELFRFDQLYRLFHEEEGKVLLHGGDILKSLKEKIENCYSHWYMGQLSLAWSPFVESAKKETTGLLKHWKLAGMTNQQYFFRGFVSPILKNTPSSKVFVIISDALRYEAAEELTKTLNQKNRFQAQIETQLGVLPSYTSLGMAALLPHEKLSYKANKNVEILLDGQPTASLEQRKKILEPFEGTAIKADELINMKREDGRAFVKSHRVLYIYHDTIDAIGDKASTEGKTFHAVRDAINELSALVRHVINTLSGNHVLLTADHGFLFQDSFPEVQDKSPLDEKPAGTLKSKKRYLLGTNLPDHPQVWHGHTKNTAGADGDMELWVPKGANRFHFTGGARFVHGGAMPQEVFVPVITIKQIRGDAAKKAKTRKVEVSLLGTKHKVTTNRHRLEFVQTEIVSETVLPRSLTIGLWDGETLISSEETLTFASDSPLMDERKKSIQLLLKSGQYDKKKDYFLTMRDAETKTEYLRVTFSINLAFTSDF